MTSLLVVAGEASGDLHGARLLVHLRRNRPDVTAFGLGGGELARAGLEKVAESAEITVVGITEVLRVLRRARQIFRQLLAEVDRLQVDAEDLLQPEQQGGEGQRVEVEVTPQLHVAGDAPLAKAARHRFGDQPDHRGGEVVVECEVRRRDRPSSAAPAPPRG